MNQDFLASHIYGVNGSGQQKNGTECRGAYDCGTERF